MIKSVLDQLERKQEEDRYQRQSEQNEIKLLMEQRMMSLVEKLKADER